jgi:hypothetical protein
MQGNTEIVFSRSWNRTQLQCPFLNCNQMDHTHIVDVKWEIDPDEGDRKRVRMEIRCENGHGFVLNIKNHAGSSFLEWEAMTDNRSPFGMDSTW